MLKWLQSIIRPGLMGESSVDFWIANGGRNSLWNSACRLRVSGLILCPSMIWSLISGSLVEILSSIGVHRRLRRLGSRVSYHSVSPNILMEIRGEDEISRYYSQKEHMS